MKRNTNTNLKLVTVSDKVKADDTRKPAGDKKKSAFHYDKDQPSKRWYTLILYALTTQSQYK